MSNLFIMIIILIIITSFLFMLNLLLTKKKINAREKLSPFECGFDPLSSTRLPFSIQFYLIGIIFLIFDIEIILFLPMISSFLTNTLTQWITTSMIFILILLFGLYMEWTDGALTWLV